MVRALLLSSMLALSSCSTAPPGPELPAPWGELRLPVGDGVVENAEPDELHVRYSEADHKETIIAWRRALMKRGWESGDPRGMSGIIVVEFTNGDETLDMTASAAGKRVDMLLTR